MKFLLGARDRGLHSPLVMIFLYTSYMTLPVLSQRPMHLNEAAGGAAEQSCRWVGGGQTRGCRVIGFACHGSGGGAGCLGSRLGCGWLGCDGNQVGVWLHCHGSGIGGHSSLVGCCRRSRNGGPQIFLPAACGVAQAVAQYGPSSTTQAQDPREGPSLAGRTTEGSSGVASLGGLARRRRDQGRVPREVPVTQTMTIETRRAPACAVSLLPLRCKGSKHRLRYQAKVTVSVQQDEDQHNGRMEVIVEPRTASPPESLAVEDQL